MSTQFIILDENDKRAIAESKIVNCTLKNGMKVSIVDENGFNEWRKEREPYRPFNLKPSEPKADFEKIYTDALSTLSSYNLNGDERVVIDISKEVTCRTCKYRNGWHHLEPCRSCKDFSNWCNLCS